MKTWTENDIQKLKDLYGTMPNKELVSVIGKSKQALQHQAYRLRITTKKVANYKMCVDCGIKLSRASCYKESAERCVPCSSKNNSADKHHNWKGGVSSLRSLVHILLKPVWINPILKRDNYTCRFCSKRGGDMNVHHVYPYRLIRDQVIKGNPGVNLRTFEGRKFIALKIVEIHKLSYGITLCVDCHNLTHNEKRGELLGSPEKDNQQPSRSNVINIVGRKVHRLTPDDMTTNKGDTSAPHLPKGDDIVGAYR